MLRRLVLLAALASAPWLAGCSSHPPAHWAQGGAPTAIARARWERGSDTVDVLPDGRVLVDGDHVFTLDAAGRIMNADHGSLALLHPDGTLIGNDEQRLGQVGIASASPPGSAAAWLTVAPTGEVTFYDPEGGRSLGGAWSGCEGPMFRTCTLVSHMVAMRDVARRPRVGVGIGVGFGFGMRR